MSARRPLIAGNWKMHRTQVEAEALVTALLEKLPARPRPEVLVLPPFTALPAVARVLAADGRVALGAQRKEVLGAALGRAFKLLAFGSAAGLLLGILASRLLALIVYEATPRDPLVLLGAVVSMALLGLLATWIPARRAILIDPVILLREE